MRNIKFAAALFVAVSACATTPPQTLQVATPSGRPEALFLTGEVSEAAGQVASGCMNAGMTVVSNNGYQVVCEVAMTMTQSVVTQLAIGNSYSTTPRQFIQFNLADTGDAVRAQATGWVETQMAFGQMRRMPIDQSIAWKNQMQQALFSVGGVPVPGTVDSSAKAKIGFLMADLSPDGKVGERGAVFVSGVFPGGPAEVAGLQVCDRVDYVNGAKVVNVAGYTLEASRTAAGSPIKITVTRGGQSLDLNVVATTGAIRMDPASYSSNASVTSDGCKTLPPIDSSTEENSTPIEVSSNRSGHIGADALNRTGTPDH
jgi:hypothetical protein